MTHLRLATVLLTATTILAFLPRQAAQARTSSAVLTGAGTNQRVVALTFDDGPSAYTPQVLAILNRYGIHATFFEVGRYVALSPGTVRAVAANGNEIGDHTYSHPNLLALSNAQVLWELGQTSRLIASITGHAPRWFRPPYGLVDGRVESLAGSLGMRTVTWNVDPTDWSLPGTDTIVARVMSQVRPGSVILLHDGGGYRGETVEALPIIIAQLRAQGYRFVTLSDLFFPPKPAPFNFSWWYLYARRHHLPLQSFSPWEAYGGRQRLNWYAYVWYTSLGNGKDAGALVSMQWVPPPRGGHGYMTVRWQWKRGYFWPDYGTWKVIPATVIW